MACERLIARLLDQRSSVFGHSVQGGASVGLVVTRGRRTRAIRSTSCAAPISRSTTPSAPGAASCRLFDESMDEWIRFRRRIENGLAEAIANGELSLVYQPIVVARRTRESSGSRRCCAGTAPSTGRSARRLFIPIAEESNLIHELGDWVLNEALDGAEALAGPICLGQLLAAPVPPAEFRRPRRRTRPARRHRAGRRADRDHRDRDLRRCRARRRDALQAAPDGLPDRARRFRHRLFSASTTSASSRSIA